jgi:hypothetical protein
MSDATREIIKEIFLTIKLPPPPQTNVVNQKTSPLFKMKLIRSEFKVCASNSVNNFTLLNSLKDLLILTSYKPLDLPTLDPNNEMNRIPIAAEIIIKL